MLLENITKFLTQQQRFLEDTMNECRERLNDIEELKSMLKGMKVRSSRFISRISSRVGETVYIKLSYGSDTHELISGVFEKIRESNDGNLIYLVFSDYKELCYDEDEKRYNEFRERTKAEVLFNENEKYEFIAQKSFVKELQDYKEKI